MGHLCHKMSSYVFLSGQGTFHIGAHFVGLEPRMSPITSLLLLFCRCSLIESQSVGNLVSQRDKVLMAERVRSGLHKASFHSQEQQCMMIMGGTQVGGMVGISNDVTSMDVISLIPMGFLTFCPAVGC